MHLLAQPTLRTDAHAVADDQHPDHQFGIDGGPARLAVEGPQMRADAGQVNEEVDRTQKVRVRNVILEAEAVEQRIGLKVTVWQSDHELRRLRTAAKTRPLRLPADAISKALPKHDRSKVEHHRALPYDQMAAALETIRSSDASLSSKLALEFLALTATRSGETRGATWGEFDEEKAEWVIPASRMKAKRPHRVPLSPRTLEILEKAKGLKSDDSNYVFPGTVTGKPLSDNTLSKLLRELGIDAVPHGFRSSFRDWAGEQTNFPREVCEFALAHVIKEKAEAAYARSDLFEKRRMLMNAWAQYLKKPTYNVVPLAFAKSV